MNKELELLSKIKSLVSDIPECPGVYKMLDADGKIIYIGKAKNLKKRVTSYFSRASGKSIKTQKLVDSIQDISYIETGNELEALILETNLIKEHRPKYNVLMKDDKNFIYIKITTNEDYPRILTVREREKDGALYFGPKTNATRVEKTLNLIRKIFPTRTCNLDMTWVPNTKEPGKTNAIDQSTSEMERAQTAKNTRGEVKIKNRTIPIPCLEYHIKRCNAPCINAESKDDYNRTIKSVIQFLKGNYRDIVTRLKYQMFAEAKNKHFEKAAKLRDQIKGVEDLFAKQKVSDPEFIDRDVIGIHQDFDKTFVNLFQFREGKLVGTEQFALQTPPLGGWGGTDYDSPLETFIKYYYSESTAIPTEILVRDLPEDKETLENWLTERYLEIPENEESHKQVHLLTTQKGKKDQILKLSEKNAQAFAKQSRTKWMSDASKTSQAAKDLADELGLTSVAESNTKGSRSPAFKSSEGSPYDTLPFKGELFDTKGGELRRSKGNGLDKGIGEASTLKRIECYDISHMGGEHTTASMVVFTNGAPETKLYRHFKLKTLENGEIDDYASMKEILTRRLRRLTETLPDDVSNITFKKPGKKQQEEIERCGKPESKGKTDPISAEKATVPSNDREKELGDGVTTPTINFTNSVLASDERNTPIAFAQLIDHEDGKVQEIKVTNYRLPVARSLTHALLKKIIEKTKLLHLYTITDQQTLDHFESFGFTRLRKIPGFLDTHVIARNDKGATKQSHDQKIPLIFKRDRTKKIDDSFSQIPDLIIVDGGKGQLSIAHEVIKNSGLTIPVAGLAKKEEEIFMRRNDMSRETPTVTSSTTEEGSFLKIILPRGSQALYLVQRIRDEAHRFANQLRKKLGKKQLTASAIDDIPGIGLIIKRRLLKEYGSTQKIREASFEDLEKTVGTYIAKMLKDKL